MAEAPSWEALTARPSFFGNPLLFPFAYGVASGAFEYGGRRYEVRPTRWGRVAHGLVRDHAWTVERTWTDEGEDHITASISTAHDSDKLAAYPFPFRLSATYTLDGTALTLRARATNLAEMPMPFGFGVHPYLPIPFDPRGTLSDDVVISDVTHVDAEGPTRAGLPAPDVVPGSGGPFDLRAGQTVDALLAAQRERRPAGGLFLRCAKAPGSGVSGAAAHRGEGIRWSLANRRLGVAVEVETSADLRFMVLFAPAEPTTAISPVIGTCLPGFLDAANRGKDMGLRELAPGESWSAQVTMRVRVCG